MDTILLHDLQVQEALLGVSRSTSMRLEKELGNPRQPRSLPALAHFATRNVRLTVIPLLPSVPEVPEEF